MSNQEANEVSSGGSEEFVNVYTTLPFKSSMWLEGMQL